MASPRPRPRPCRCPARAVTPSQVTGGCWCREAWATLETPRWEAGSGASNGAAFGRARVGEEPATSEGGLPSAARKREVEGGEPSGDTRSVPIAPGAGAAGAVCPPPWGHPVVGRIPRGCPPCSRCQDGWEQPGCAPDQFTPRCSTSPPKKHWAGAMLGKPGGLAVRRGSRLRPSLWNTQERLARAPVPPPHPDTQQTLAPSKPPCQANHLPANHRSQETLAPSKPSFPANH